jgi:hypothetical protein
VDKKKTFCQKKKTSHILLENSNVPCKSVEDLIRYNNHMKRKNKGFAKKINTISKTYYG